MGCKRNKPFIYPFYFLNSLIRNTNVKTIEGDLFKALCAAGAVSEFNSDSQNKIQLQRSCRTDKNVHAARQLISLKLQKFAEKDLAEQINRHLPDQIRVYGVQRVNGSFNAHNSCTSRIYEYRMPTYVLRKLGDGDQDSLDLIRNAKEFIRENETIQVPDNDDAEMVQGNDKKFIGIEVKLTAEEMGDNQKYRIDPETLQKLKHLLSFYHKTKYDN